MHNNILYREVMIRDGQGLLISLQLVFPNFLFFEIFIFISFLYVYCIIINVYSEDLYDKSISRSQGVFRVVVVNNLFFSLQVTGEIY